MQQIKGKYNTANVMIDEIDETTRKQIQGFVNNPSFGSSYIAIMPDCHAGAGSCIGFTMQMNDRIIPDVVGVDIGCGMLSAKFPVEHIDLPAFDAFIKHNIPAGFATHKHYVVHTDAPFVKSALSVGAKMKMDEVRLISSIGTLGGGNHFIEAGYGDDGKLWVTIHSGSRNFGLQVAKYHGQVAKNLCDRYGSDTQGIPFLLVDSFEGQEYIRDQQIAVTYATLNRISMLNIISKFFKVDPVETIHSVHNFIDPSGMIRKGATSANAGEKLIIPFNMRDGLAICVGKGNKKYNCSAPHGAGRILSRSKAKELLDVEYFKEDMKQAGVYTTTATKDTLDESPDAYKDMALILDNIKETVDVVEMVKPIYNFKAGGD